MILYNVTLKVETDAVEAWVSWMKEEHMPSLMATGCFIDCRLCRLLEQDEADGVTFAAQYTCTGMEQYNRYIDEYSVKIREQSFQVFGGRFVAFRTLMEIL